MSGWAFLSITELLIPLLPAPPWGAEPAHVAMTERSREVGCLHCMRCGV